MPQLIISQEGLADYGKLAPAQQAQVRDAFSRFSEHTHAGLHLEKMANPADPRVRTIRVSRHYRGIVMAPDRGDVFVLHRVLTHDQADKWVANNRFEVNPASGALEVHNLAALEAAGAAVADAPPEAEPLFADVRERSLKTLGIPDTVLPVVYALTDEAQLESLCRILPEGQADVLEALYAGFTEEEVWAEMVAGSGEGEIDTDDVVAALDRPSTRTAYYVTDDMDELIDVLNKPFDTWRVFLHPSQHRYAYKKTYNGPARVTGGPGTGKTVVALHRAKALFDQSQESGAQILFTTFTRNLADAIKQALVLLAGPDRDILSRVDVVNIDKLASRLVTESEGRAPSIAVQQRCTDLWQQIVDETGIDRAPSFLDAEWREVVLGQNITSRAGYLSAPRPGRGVPLNRRQRIEVWQCIEEFTARLAAAGERTHEQIADAATQILESRTVKPYRHVIVDEAQDLNPGQWRLLRAVTPEDVNDLFIVGDTHQRIYANRVTLSRVGINIRGRSHKLRLNYRTTAQILHWSLGLVRGEPFDDLDGGDENLTGYRSRLHGPEPTLQGFSGRPAQLDALAEQVQAWIDSGIEPETIGVTARTKALCEDAASALDQAGIATSMLSGSDDAGRDGVAVGTMHRLKGLEFRCVAVIDVDSTRVPLPAALQGLQDDEEAHARAVRRERSLLFVACSRARDDLWIGWSGNPSPFIEPMLEATKG